jgi:ppGpp synthetase/RelA/SpoT-type nucleotidyltranferase
MTQFDRVLAETQKFLFDNQAHYLRLVKLVKAYLHERIAPLLSSTEAVFFIYSRKDQPSQSGEIKDLNRLTAKIMKFKERNPETWRDKGAAEIHDIVACRVLVYYRSQIGRVVEEIKRSVEDYDFSVVDEVYRDKFGYHAHHLILRCNRLDLRNILCEVQVKTILHDAWSCKTHGFIYRPPNILSRHAKELMQSMGDSIEALEVQSENLRLMVNKEWMFEKKLRRAARTAELDKLAHREFSDPDLTRRCKEFHGRITQATTTFSSCSIADIRLKAIVNEIECMRRQHGIEPAFQLMLLLASIREPNDLNRIALQYMEDWISNKDKTGSEAAFWKSSILYMIGERDSAISVIRAYLRESQGKPDGNDTTVWYLKFNLLNYLIDGAMQTETSQFLAESEKLRRELNLDLLDSSHANFGAVQDTLGAFLIAFAQSEDEIEAGITKCRNAYVSTEDKAGAAFQKLHEQMGWSKLLKSEFGSALL